MPIEIRPRSVGANLDLSFRVLGRAFGTLFLIVLLTTLPGVLFQLWAVTDLDTRIQLNASMDREPVFFDLVDWVSVPINFVFNAIALGAGITKITACFTGEKVTLGQSVSAGIANLPRLIGYRVLWFLIAMGPFLACLVVGLTAQLPPMILLSLLFLVTLTIFFLWFYVGEPALVFERLGVTAAFGRSRALTKGHRGMVFMFLSLAYLVVFLLNLVLGGCLGGVIAAAVGAGPMEASLLVIMIPTMIVGIVAGMFQMILPVVLYFDLRARKERFSIGSVADLVARIATRHGSADGGSATRP